MQKKKNKEKQKLKNEGKITMKLFEIKNNKLLSNYSRKKQVIQILLNNNK